ncbi:MAG TPA: mannose-1-phosphate guanylyltransferase [Gemmatimonadaceae bacterium]|nr:mannose-1-phosphate guanylyltransferase [Gemmatimonadaceae bacterium]
MSRWAVVLAGGVGSRFWPLSTPERPKQLLPLVSNKPLLRDTVDRLGPIVDPSHTLILTNANLVKPIRSLLPPIPRENIIAEPRPAGTAAALAWAALTIERRDGPEATMLSVHADWSIGNDARFREVLLLAEAAATRTHTLVTVGVVPSRPDTGFGYIQPSDPDEASGSPVLRFVEKPDRQRAEKMVSEGYLWNSGIFVWTVGDFLAQIRKHARELARAMALGPDGEASDFFGRVANPVSVDVAVLERSKDVTVVPGDFGWDDVGTWSALARVRTKDEFGNVTAGNVHLLDGADNVVHADSGAVVLYGVDNLVVVARDGLTLVTTKEKAADLKRLVESLPPMEQKK